MQTGYITYRVVGTGRHMRMVALFGFNSAKLVLRAGLLNILYKKYLFLFLGGDFSATPVPTARSGPRVGRDPSHNLLRRPFLTAYIKNDL